MSLLTRMVEEEAARRAVIAQRNADRTAAHARVVKGIHEAFAPYAEEIGKLQLIGDYGKSVLQSAAQDVSGSGGSYYNTAGVMVALASKISKTWLRLTVHPERDDKKLHVVLDRYSYSSYNNGVVATFDPETHSAETMIEALFKELLPQVWTEKAS